MTIRYVGLSPFNWLDYDRDGVELKSLPERKYPISPPVHYGFDVIRGYRGVFELGTPQHAQFWTDYRESHGLGAPMAASPTRTTKKASPAASERVGGRPSSAHGRRKQTSVSARGKCPKGHYWSYKLKKCVRSNFN